VEIVKIHTEYIKLDQLLKLHNVCQSGGEAKMMIQDELVKLNGNVVTERGKKIRNQDVISIEGIEDFKVEGI
jgi:ribosome-associated protein